MSERISLSGVLRKDPRLRKVILDGEIVAYDPVNKRRLPYGRLSRIIHSQSNTSSKSKNLKKSKEELREMNSFQIGDSENNDSDNDDQNEFDTSTYNDTSSTVNDENATLVYIVFDLLLVNETAMTRIPLRKRREWLRNILGEQDDLITIIPHSIGRTAGDILDKMDGVLMDGGEGVVVKCPKGLYMPGRRGGGDGGTWFKLKPDFYTHMGEHLDLCIVGVSYSKFHYSNFSNNYNNLDNYNNSSNNDNNNDGVFSTFTCAVRADVENATAAPNDIFATRWLTLVRVGIGFSHALLSEMSSHFSKVAQRTSSGYPPWLDSTQDTNLKSTDLPDLWVEPWHSIVIQVKASEIVGSRNVGAGLTMRFPRFVRMREDKAWWSASTVCDVRHLLTSKQSFKMRLLAKHPQDKNNNNNNNNRQERSTIVSHQKIVDVAAIEVEDGSIFAGVEVCVLTGSADATKQQVEEMIVKLGGRIVASPTATTSVVVVGKRTFRTKHYVELKEPQWDVVDVKWIVDCHLHRRRIHLQPKYVLNATRATAMLLSTSMDRYGDLYTEPVTADELSLILDSVQLSDGERMSEVQCKQFIIDLGLYDTPEIGHTLFFFPFIFFFDRHHSAMDGVDPFEVSSVMAQMYGAEIARSHNDDGVTHIIVTTIDRLSFFINEFNQSATHDKRVHVVSADWLSACLNESAYRSEYAFQ